MTVPNGFTLVKSVPSPLSKASRVESYEHVSGARVVFLGVPGPLCQACIVLPTEPPDNKGLPHTLEHLCFMGSKGSPERGFLDTLATRCVSNGTNAWTFYDYTSYQMDVAGPLGLHKLLPVFLDHVLRPTLTDHAFTTEVYHVDGDGKEQGVVFCEMQGRENTEADILTRTLYGALYPNSGYGLDAGGLTPDIRQLTNDDIRRYHQACYTLDHINIIIQGAPEVDITPALQSLEKILADISLEQSHATPDPKTNTTSVRPWTTALAPLQESVSLTVPFSSQDEDFGSVTYGWRGPLRTDLETRIAIEVLFRYLQGNSSTPLQQRFVSCARPLANDIDFEFNMFQETSFEITFSGVPLRREYDEYDSRGSDSEDGANDDDDDDDDDADVSEYSEGDDDDDDDDDDLESSGDYPEDLFANGSFSSRFFDMLRKVRDEGLPGGSDIMMQCVRRHRVKFFEDLEDNGASTSIDYTIPEMIFLPRTSKSKDRHQHCHHDPQWVRIPAILDCLERKDKRYWLSLLDKWLLQAPHVEVIMTPSIDLASKQQEDEAARQQDLVAQLKAEGLAQCGEKVRAAVEANKPALSREIMRGMPSIPAYSEIPQLRCQYRKDWNPTLMCPAHECELDTQFKHIRFVTDTSSLPSDLKKFLPLFGELLLESPIEIPPSLRHRYQEFTRRARAGGASNFKAGKKRAFKEPLFLPHDEVVRQYMRDVVHIGAQLGVGSQYFSSSFMPNLFYIFTTAEVHKFDIMCEWVALLLCFTQFTRDRILSAAQNLLSALIEEKREGDEVCTAVSTLLLSDAESNDVAISIFAQEQFLQDVIAAVKSKRHDAVQDALNTVRRILYSPNASFFYTTHAPPGMSGKRPSFQRDHEVFAEVFKHYWAKTDFYQPRPVLTPVPNHFPYTYRTHIRPNACRGVPSVAVPITGIESTFLEQYVPCAVDYGSDDYYPVLMLCEAISRSEGPLYTAIRGKGLSYGAYVSFYPSTHMLGFSLYETSQPAQCTQLFRDVLVQLGEEERARQDVKDDDDDDDNDDHRFILSQDNLASSRAALLHSMVSSTANAAGVIQRVFTAQTKGFADLENERHFQASLDNVKRQDIVRVFHKYFAAFLPSPPPPQQPTPTAAPSTDDMVTVVTLPAAREDEIVQAFRELDIDLQVKTLSDLKLAEGFSIQ